LSRAYKIVSFSVFSSAALKKKRQISLNFYQKVWFCHWCC
jgi:hypothetical protein